MRFKGQWYLMYCQVLLSALQYPAQKVYFCDFHVLQNKERLCTAAKVLKQTREMFVVNHNTHEYNGHGKEVGAF